MGATGRTVLDPLPEDILNLSGEPIDWARQIVEDLPCNEIATTTNHHQAMTSPISAATHALAITSEIQAAIAANLPLSGEDIRVTTSHLVNDQNVVSIDLLTLKADEHYLDLEVIVRPYMRLDIDPKTGRLLTRGCVTVVVNWTEGAIPRD